MDIQKPKIELVIHKPTGRLTNCFALDNEGNRAVQLPVLLSEARFEAGDLGKVRIDMLTLHVKRTEEE